MKLCTVFLICCGIFAAEAQKCVGEVYRRIIENCAAEYKMTPAELVAVNAWKSASTDHDKCFRACVMTACDEMDAEGNLIPDGYKQFHTFYTHRDASITESNIREIDNCLKTSQVMGDRCATAAKYMDCIRADCKACDFGILNQKIEL